MKVSRPNPDRLILEHGPWRNVRIVFAGVAALMFWAFSKGLLAGLVVSFFSFGFAWLATRRFEQVRGVFDRTAGRVGIRCRTIRYGNATATCDLDEIGSADAGVKRPGSPLPLPACAGIPDGPHTGRHPLNPFEIDERRAPDHTRTRNHWLEQTP